MPVINKIDLPSAEPEKAREQIEQVVGIPADDAVLTSAKMGIGIEELLERIVRDIPPPEGRSRTRRSRRCSSTPGTTPTAA